MCVHMRACIPVCMFYRMCKSPHVYIRIHAEIYMGMCTDMLRVPVDTLGSGVSEARAEDAEVKLRMWLGATLQGNKQFETFRNAV